MRTMYKRAPGLVAADPGLATSTWRVSTPDVDRDSDVVCQLADWQTDNWYLQGAPWLLDHGTNDSRPVGTSIGPDGRLALWAGRDGTYATCYHNLRTQLGRDVYALVQDGVLAGASVGFLPDASRMTRRANRPKGHVIGGLELLEISLVACPSNPLARPVKGLAGGRRAGALVLKSVSRAAREAEALAMIAAAVEDLRWRAEALKREQFAEQARAALRPITKAPSIPSVSMNRFWSS